jgi:hypothetical protein
LFDVLIPLYTAVLYGRASCKSQEHMTLNAEKTAWVQLTIALNEIAKSVFNNPAEVYTVQKHYLKKSGLRMWKAKPSKFGHQLETLNGYLEYFPRRELAEGTLLQNRPRSEDELLEIVDEARPSGIQKLMIASKDSMTKYDSFDRYISALDG